MILLKKLRDIEVKYGDKWLLIDNFQKLKKGQTFRMWDDETTPVYDRNGNTEFLAISDPYYSEKYGEWSIDCDLTEYSENVN